MQQQYLEEKRTSESSLSGKWYSPLRLLYIRAGCVCLVAGSARLLALTPASAGESVHSYQASSFSYSEQSTDLVFGHKSHIYEIDPFSLRSA